jgi:hypothetical protein
MRELRVELLVGRKVVDATGEKAGHIEEIVAEYREGGMYVTEVHLGRTGFAERFSLGNAGQLFTSFFGARMKSRHAFRYRWEDVDFSDPERPRLKLNARALE